MGFWHAVLPYIEVVLPTAVVALIFWFVMRAVLNADRREREADDAMAKEYDARMKERVAELRASRTSGPDAAVPDAGRPGSAGDVTDARGESGDDAEPGAHRDS